MRTRMYHTYSRVAAHARRGGGQSDARARAADDDVDASTPPTALRGEKGSDPTVATEPCAYRPGANRLAALLLQPT